MNVLITGAAGLVGDHVRKHLSKDTRHRLILIDRNKPDPADDNLIQVPLEDRLALEKLFATEKLQCVIHLAAMPNAVRSVQEPLECYITNVVHTINLLELCVSYNVGMFLFASSGAVYQPSGGPLAEDATKWGADPYAQSKIMCEQVLADVAKAHPDFRYVSLRFFRVTGADRPHSVNKQLSPIRIAAQVALGRRDKMIIFGDNFDTVDGTCVRDFIHIEDLVRMVSASLSYLETNNESTTFNCASGKGYSLKQIVDTMMKISAVEFKVQVEDKRPNEIPSLVADISRAKALLGWRPRHDSLASLCQVTLEREKVLPLL